MDGSRHARNGGAAGSSPPSLFLLGMRSAGKTTLGRLAAEHLGARFLDADDIFTTRHTSPKAFVAEHGWDAFRAAETSILEEALQEARAAAADDDMQNIVVSLGGGVVDPERNRHALTESWSKSHSLGQLDPKKRIAVVHIFREVDKALLDLRGLPNWTAGNANEVWQRRRPHFRASSSHEFVNFTDSDYIAASQGTQAPQWARLQFEAVERDFVRFLTRLRRAFQEQNDPFLPPGRRRSFLVTLPFADLRPNVEKLADITIGADAVEFRADLLSDPVAEERLVTSSNASVKASADETEAYENPSLSYLSEQVGLVRRHLPYVPLVFTLRTPAQGGRYPYPANAPSSALFASLRHALKLTCDVIDIEQGLDEDETNLLIREAKARNITVMISWRDVHPPHRGGFHWGQAGAREIYERAKHMGADVIKIVGTAGEVSDNFSLRVFAAQLDEMRREQTSVDLPPLSAYNMGYRGRISRFLNPHLASVTHPLIKRLTRHGVVGDPSMTFEEMQRALYLSGLTEALTFVCVVSNLLGTQSAQRVKSHFDDWLQRLGLPHSLVLVECKGRPNPNDVLLHQRVLDHLHNIGGLMFGQTNNDAGEPSLLEKSTLNMHAQASGTCDTIVPQVTLTKLRARDSRSSKGPEEPAWVGTDKLCEALVELVGESVSPTFYLDAMSTAAVLVTRGEESGCCARSAREALRSLRFEQVIIITAHDAHRLSQARVVIDIRTRSALPQESESCASSLIDRLSSAPFGGEYKRTEAWT